MTKMTPKTKDERSNQRKQASMPRRQPTGKEQLAESRGTGDEITIAVTMRGTMTTRRIQILLLIVMSSQQLALQWAFSPVPQSGAHSRSSTGLRSSKGPDDFFSAYDDEELWDVLKIHRQLTDQQEETASPSRDEDEPMSIHEAFLKSQGEETMQSLLDLHESITKGETGKILTQREKWFNSASPRQNEDTTIPPSSHDLVREAAGTANEMDCNGASNAAVMDVMQWDDEILKKIAKIRAIASDVDGTLLTSQQSLHPRSRQAILRAMQSPNEFFLATGKSRKGALNSLGVEMTAILENVPGVFLQGLYCVDGEGNVVFEKKLTNAAVKAVEQLADECNVSPVAYDGDKLYSTGMTDSVRELSERYGEPKVTPLTTPLSEYEPGFHKILLVHENVDFLTTTVRSKLDALAEENSACVTQAVPTMLEWLPEGCSKAKGVSILCEAMGIDPSTELLAIGDAENDGGMLEMASIGVAVGNASPIAQDAADFLLEETNDQGGAGAAMELFGFGPN